MYVVLCYGDSNTYGRDPITKKRMDRDIRWPGVLQNTLESDYHVIEEGLNGRTTVWDDPVRGLGKRNGSFYLFPCLESHCPIDLVIMMLGTNDLKVRYSVTPYDIGESIGFLIEIIQRSKCGRDDSSPEILLLAPPPLGKVSSDYSETFTGGIEKSKELPSYYKAIAEQYGCHFFNTSTVIQSSRIDGLHIDPEDHKTLGKEVSKIVPKILDSKYSEVI